MKRYIIHGSFGTPGINRVRLIQSRATGVYIIDYRDKSTGKRYRINLNTIDLVAAQKEILRITDELAEQGHSRQRNGNVPAIYVIQRGENGPIKVGISRDLRKRLDTFQTANAEKLKVLRTFTLADVERAIHAELEKTGRLEDEWFSADLLPIIDRFFTVPHEIIKKRREHLNSKFEKRVLLR